MAVPRVGAVGWVRLALAGALLMGATALLCLLRVPVLPLHGHGFGQVVWSYRLRFVVYLLPFGLGLGLMIWAEKRFKRGYRDDLWTEPELAQVRRLVGRKLWSGLGGLILGLWVVALFFQHSLHGGGAWYLLVMPGQLAQRIQRLITPRVERSSPLADWRSFGPIRSEHWGEGSVRS